MSHPFSSNRTDGVQKRAIEIANALDVLAALYPSGPRPSASPAEVARESTYADMYRSVLRSSQASAVSDIDGWLGGSRVELRNYFDRKLQEQRLRQQLLGVTRSLATESFEWGANNARVRMGIPGLFRLEDSAARDWVDGAVYDLAGDGGKYDIYEATLSDLTEWGYAAGTGVDPQAEDGGDNYRDSVFYGILALVAARSAARSVLIAETEGVRASRAGMLAFFAANGATTLIHQCQDNVERSCSTRVCLPYCGEEFTVPAWGGGVLDGVFSRVPSGIPLHPRCRCYYEIREPFTVPEQIWLGQEWSYSE